MTGWRIAWGAAKGYARVSRAASNAAATSWDRAAVERLPRQVRRRGWVAPGDPPLPPGTDMLDYSALAPADVVRTRLMRRSGVVIGAAIDPASGQPFAAYSLPVERLFQHLAVVAPPGKGKTYGVMAPLAVRLLRAGVSVVALDVTGSLVDRIRQAAEDTATGSTVPFLHWTTDHERGRHSWNPLANIEPDDLTAIEGLKTSILGESPADPRHQMFHDRELRILGALLRLAVAGIGAPTFTTVLRLALDRPFLAGQLREPRFADLVYDLHDYLSADADRAAEFVTTIQSRLAPFVTPQVRPLTERADFDVSDVLRRPTLLVAGAELYLRQRGEIAGALLVNRLSAELARRHDDPRGVPVVLLLDEAPVLARRIDLAALLATARATRAGVVVAAQNVTQFGDADARSSVFDACDSMMLLPGASEASRTIFVSRLGSRDAARRSVTREFGRGTGSVSTSSETVPVIGARELLDPPFGAHPAFLHVRSDGLGAVPLELDRMTVAAMDAS